MYRSMRGIVFLFLGFLTITTFHFNSCNGNSYVGCRDSERDALLSFKRDFKDPSRRLSSWVIKDDCCKWVGIVCDNLTGYVRELDLQNPYVDYQTQVELEAYERHKLGGKISPSLLKLKHLSYLDLSGNDFEGIQIPGFIGSIGSLRYLNLSKAGFEGIIPHQLGNLSGLRYLGLKGPDPNPKTKLNVESLQWLFGLSSLKHLDISNVNLSKAPNWLQLVNMLPSLLELRLSYCGLDRIHSLPKVNFTSLAVLDISWNSFNSMIPEWIFSLSTLASLDLSVSDFEGPIPGGSWNMTSLRVLDVSANYLNSSLPNWLFRANGLVSLNLHDNGFQGPIPSGLQNMTNLRNLDLSKNHFNSTLPDWLYSFSQLQSLNLNSNDLHGTIGDVIANLTSLIMLDLSYNELSGRLPRSLGNLCNLISISLLRNKFGGEVFEILKSFSGCVLDSLESLNLRENQLSGHLTNELGQFNNLKSLDLGGNFISGPIPASIGNLSSLKLLDVSNNQLNGSLPKSLGLLSQLEQLHISDNFLEGVVSEVHFAHLKNLRELVASRNQFSLKVSADWVPPFQLKLIEFRSCHLGQQFPMWLQYQKDFEYLDLSSTGISDDIPTWFWKLSSNFRYLNLSHNQIHGEIPDIVDVTFSVIYLSSNQFRGQLPGLSSNVTELDLSNNLFSGGISHFLCDKTNGPKQMKVLHLGDNLLSGEIPNCWMNWQWLQVIKLENNNLTGRIPNSMGLLRALRSLHLRNNSLFGEVPPSLQNCVELVTLDLGVNKFNGSIPTWMGSFSNLLILDLRSNKFGGEIPLELCHLTSLQIFDLADNSLSGRIPSCFNNLKAMAMKQNSSGQISYSFYWGELLENAFAVTKGREVQYSSILSLVTSMDLSSNNLSGKIPDQLTSLMELRSLNLSRNYLTGNIPLNIGDMESLESIDFSRNELSGDIPPSMSSLTFLSFLNLSYNNLTGKIPLSTQLQSFSCTSFIGNQLCGPPLTENCSTDGVAENTGNGREKDGDGINERVWFYLSASLGFVLGFWGVFGPIMFNRSWRRAYFQLLGNMWFKLCNYFNRRS